MLSSRFGLKKMDISAILLYIAIFKFSVGPQVLQQIFKIAFIGIVVLMLFRRFSIKKLKNIVVLMTLSFATSSLVGDVVGRSILDGILNAICIYCIYGVTEMFSKADRMDKFIDILFYMTLVYCIISLCSIFYLGTSIYGTEKEYFFGNKFSTSYFFILLTGLYYVKNFSRRKKRLTKFVFFLLSVLAFWVSYWIHCNTAFLGTVVLLVGALVPDFTKEILQNRKVIVIFLAVMGVSPFFINSILQIRQIQFIFYQLMGKSVGLTGRLHIYDLLPQIIMRRPIFGYGYNSNIVADIAGYGNAQNGLCELAVNFGIVGVLLFVIMVFHSLGVEKSLKNHGIYMVLYTLILCSAVEVSYNYFFYVALFILHFSSNRATVAEKRKKVFRI